MGSVIDTRNFTAAPPNLSIKVPNLSIDTQRLIVEVQNLNIDTLNLNDEVPNLSVDTLSINDASSTLNVESRNLTAQSRNLNRYPGLHSAGLSGFFFAFAFLKRSPNWSATGLRPGGQSWRRS